MIAVDTNVIVRYLTRDDPAQFERAATLVAQEQLFVCTTVLLETEWVLRGAYRFTRTQIGNALSAFAGLPQISLEAPALAATALNWMEEGMDFADALHLAATENCERFVSFDERFASAARRVGRVVLVS